jgi:potassium efflux system protein
MKSLSSLILLTTLLFLLSPLTSPFAADSKTSLTVAATAELDKETKTKLTEMVNHRRQLDTEKVLAEAEVAMRELAGRHPLIQQLVAQNTVLSEEIRSLATDLDRVTDAADVTEKETKRIEENFRKARQKLEIAGLSQVLGQVLQDQRRQLPDVRRYRRLARTSEMLIAESGLRQIHYSEEQNRLEDVPAYLASLTADLPPEEAEANQAELRRLLNSRLTFLQKAIITNDAYLRTLGELDFAQRQLLETAGAYDDFLAEHLLWIRSSPAINLEAIKKLPEEITQLLSPSGWFEVFKVLVYQATHSPFPILMFAVFALLIWKRKRLHSLLEEIGGKAKKPTTYKIAFSLQALCLTLLLAAAWPLLLGTLGWQLRLSLEGTIFPRAIGLTLFEMSPRIFLLLAFRVLVVPKGLAEAHFGWSETNLELLRRELARLMVIYLPFLFVTLTVYNLGPVTFDWALGKLIFVGLVLALGFFFFRVLHPKRGVVQNYLSQHPKVLPVRLRYLWFLLVIAIPLFITGLTLAGYTYTATTLTARLMAGVWLILGIIVIHQLVGYWLLQTRRKFAILATLKRRQEARAEAEVKDAVPPREEGVPIQVEEETVDLVALSDDIRKLLNTAFMVFGIIGFWFIWSEVLPALGVLNDIALWHHTALVDGQESQVPINLADGILAILIAIITFVATKRFPAFLEIVLLQRLDMTVGGRYTVTTLSRYLIAAAGTISAIYILGGSWSQVQWLVAALSLGIGFGLQEIVANFISGLIILFERPIRGGDLVTVGESTGVVTRIRIRATTIQDFDKKELLVPNKEFITGRLLNWSLSDQMSRILIPVGVAYGSDVQKAMALMAEAAEEHELVLTEPKPFVIFEGFGDNALSLTLRAYIESVEYRVTTLSKLNEEIDRKFNEAGIVIAFPQRDVHLDTTRPLEIRIRHDGEMGDSGES